MFQKYNGILRGVGSRQVESEREGRGQVPFDAIEKELGNMYTTTLHVINSAIIKLSKLTVADKVYRGISSRVLPKSMKVKDEYDELQDSINKLSDDAEWKPSASLVAWLRQMEISESPS